MTEDNQSNAKGGPMPRALRLVGVFLTVATLLGLTFFLIVIEARDHEVSVRRDVAYGELKRIDHALRDISDVSRASACAEVTPQRVVGGATELNDERVTEAIAVAESAAAELNNDQPGEAVKDGAATNEPGKHKACRLKSVRLTFAGKQARDRRTILSTEALGPSVNQERPDADGKSTEASDPPANEGRDADGRDMFDQINERLNGNTDPLAVTDVAIVTRDWDFAIALRGDAAWPANMRATLELGNPIGWEPRRADKKGGEAAGEKGGVPLETLSLGGPMMVNMGGEEVVIHAIPLDMRRAVSVGRTGVGAEPESCAPRECYLVGITRDQGLMSDISRLSPLTRASFVAAIILLLLLVPLGKLWLIDKRSSMNWPDVAAIIASVPLAIATTFVISLVWAQWLELRHDFDGDARSLAVELAHDSDQEISDTNLALIKMLQLPGGGSPPSKCEGAGDKAASVDPKADSAKPKKCAPTLRQMQAEKGIENVFAVSKQGALLYFYEQPQKSGGSGRTECSDKECWHPLFNYLIKNPPRNGVTNRRYFQRAAEGDFLPMPGQKISGGGAGGENPNSADGEDYVAAIVPSLVEENAILVSMMKRESIAPVKDVGTLLGGNGRTDGGYFDVPFPVKASEDALPSEESEDVPPLGKAGKKAGEEASNEPEFEYILANRQPFFSRHVPLPEGYSFAVLDRETLEVLQHSDVNRAGSERWGERVDDESRLRRMIDETMRSCTRLDPPTVEQASEAQTMRYIGRAVRLSIAPSCQGNWAVVVWYPADMTERLAITPAALAVALILLIGSVTGIFAVAVGMIDKRHLVALFWPDVRRMQFPKRNNTDGRIDQLDVLTVTILLAIVSLLQVLLLRGDSSFWQIFAMMCATLAIQIAFANTPKNADSLRDEQAEAQTGDEVATALPNGDHAGQPPAWRQTILRRLSIVFIAAYAIFSLLSALANRLAQTHSQILYVLLAFIGGALLIALLNSSVFERLQLSRCSRPLKSWFAENVGIRPSILRQTLTQGLIVTLVTVSPSILAYRTASSVIFEEFLAQDVVAASQMLKRRTQAFKEQCSRVAGDKGGTDYQEECEKFASSLGASGIARLVKRISRHSHIGVITAKDSKAAKDMVRVWLPEAKISRLLLKRAVGGSLQTLDEDALTVLLESYPASGTGERGDTSNRQAKQSPLKTTIDDIEKETAVDLDEGAFDIIILLILQTSPFAIFGLMGLLGYAYLCRALFGMGLFEFRSLHPRPEFDRTDIDKMSDVRPGAPPPLRLYVNYPFDKFEQLKSTLEGLGGYNFVDLARVDDAEPQLASVRTRNRPWIVVGLMRIIGAPNLRRDALDFLERLLKVDGVQVHFFSEMLPIERLQQVRELERLTHKGDPAQQDIDSIDEARHWALLLAQFVTVRWDSYWELRQSRAAEIIGGDALNGRWLNDLIRVEFEAIPNDLVRKQRESFLEELEIKSGEANDSGKREHSPNLVYRAYAPDDQPLREQVIEYLANVLSDYYQMKWIGSTREEQVLMYHLANGRFVKTTDFRTINSLINRELVNRDPDLKLMNESFAFWVRTNENPQAFHAYRLMVEQASPWSQLRLPMLVFVVLAAGALAYLDQGAVGSVLSLIPAFAAAIPVFASQAGQSRRAVPS